MKKNNAPGIFGATVGLATVVTAGFGWPEVLLGWIFSGVIRWGLPRIRGEYNDIEAWGLGLGGILVLVAVLLSAEKAFYAHGTFPFVSLGLAVLLYRTMLGEKDTGEMVSNILGMVLLVLLGIILLLGVGNGMKEELIPRGFRWHQVWITLGVSSPWWQEKEDWGWFLGSGIVSVAMSLICRYVLGTSLTEYETVPFYKVAECTKIMGTGIRMEALVSGGVLLGAYNMLVQMGDYIRLWGEVTIHQMKRKWWCLVVVGTVILLEWWYLYQTEPVKDIIDTVFWGIVPLYALLVVILRKMKKVLDKTGNVE